MQIQKAIIDDGKELQEYEFLGMRFDHKTNTVQLGTKTLGKISQMIDIVDDCQVTIRQTMSLFGRLVYASSVLQIGKHSYYWTYKFLRRRVGELLDSPAHLWKAVRDQLKDWALKCLMNIPRKVFSQTTMITRLFTDASNSGFGAVGFRSDGKVVICAGRFGNEDLREHINVKEAIAVTNGIRELDLDPVIDLTIDNTSVEYTLRKGYSRSFRLNTEIGRIKRIAQLKKHRIQDIHRISSSENPADGLSRLNLDTYNDNCVGVGVEQIAPKFSPVASTHTPSIRNPLSK